MTSSALESTNEVFVRILVPVQALPGDKKVKDLEVSDVHSLLKPLLNKACEATSDLVVIDHIAG